MSAFALHVFIRRALAERVALVACQHVRAGSSAAHVFFLAAGGTVGVARVPRADNGHCTELAGGLAEIVALHADFVFIPCGWR